MEKLPVELTRKDWLLAALLGAAAFILLHLWNCSELHPGVWGEACAAAGVRPPSEPIPGVWRCLVSPLYALLGAAAAGRVLVWLGHLSVFALALTAYPILYELLPSVMRLRVRRIAWGRLLGRGILALGTVFFLCADPVWRALQTFSPTTFALVLTMGALALAVRFLGTGRLPFAYAAMLAFGVLAADSPAGFALAACFAAAACCRSFKEDDEMSLKLIVNALLNPVVRIVALRRMAVCFFAGLALAAMANVVWFVSADGLDAHAWRGVDLVVRYFNCYWLQASSAATRLGWAFAVAACLVPIVFALWALRRATDDDAFLSYRFGLTFLAAGLVAFLQVAGLPRFWFWMWVPDAGAVKSDYLLCLGGFVSALTVTWTLCVAAVEVFVRNYRRIFVQQFPDARAEANAPVAARLHPRRRAAVWIALVLALLAATVPFRWKKTDRRMMEVVNAYLDEVVDECGDGVRTLFTDGALDEGVELRSRARGRCLRTVSMTSGSSEFDRTVRRRGVTDEEDRTMLDSGASDALRTWVNDKTNRLDGVAIQQGIELWKRAGRVLPRSSGVVAFPEGLDETTAAAGRTAGRALAERILDIYATGRPDASTDVTLREIFRRVQWRVARFCRFRADAFDRAKDTDSAVEESLLAYELDRQNALYQRLRRQTDWVSQQNGARLTPREGLKISLARSDFALARTFAEQVLQSNPDDPLANFAIGMAYLLEEQYSRAELYLKRVVAKLPDDIAALNNLAVVQIRLERFDAAQATCDHARAVAARIKDPKTRARVESDLAKTAASIARKRASAK